MILKPLSLFVMAAVLTGCVAHSEPIVKTTPDFDENMRGSACVPAGTWLDPKTLSPISQGRLLSTIKFKDIVLLGENHVALDHHRWHMQMAAQLYAQRPDMILGFEAFPRNVQAVLDQWVAGELSEAAFLEQTKWERNWSYDANFYLPLFHFARLNRIPMLALNVDKSLTREISAKGWDNVPEDQKRGISTPAPATQAYVEMLSTVYTQHDRDDQEDQDAQTPTLENQDFANFVDVQLTWDRAMAEAAVDGLRMGRDKGQDPRIVVVVGRGHTDHFLGIPEQLKDLREQNFAVLTPWDVLRKCQDLQLSDGTPVANAVFGFDNTPDFFPKPKQKLGVFIEDAEGSGVDVGNVVEGSIAETAGIQKDDRIMAAAGTPIEGTQDLIKVIKSVAPGTWLPLDIVRDGKDMTIIARFPIKSDQPQKVH